MRHAGLITVAVLGAALLGDAVTATVQRRAEPATASVSTPVAGEPLTVTVDSRGSAGAYAAVEGGYRPDRRVHVLVDSRYPLLLASARSVKGTFDHLTIDLPGGGWTGAVDRVDGQQLAADLTSDPQSVVVVTGGALPDSVLGPNRDWAPVRTFLEGGGELVFAGDGIFYWDARRDAATISLGDRGAKIDWAGELAVLGGHLVDDVSAKNPQGTVFGTSPSTAARSLGIAYSITSHGALVSNLHSLGGWELGTSTTGPSARTSLAVVPVGTGRLVLFGGGVYEAETSVDEDISRVLLSGSDIAPPSTVADATLQAHTQHGFTLPPPDPTSGARVFVYQENAFAYFHRTLRVPPA